MLVHAIVSMVAATMANHLGLAEAVGDVVTKVLQCPKCLSFWATFAVLVHTGQDLLASLAVSLLMAYLSSWFSLGVYELNYMYGRLCQLQRERSSSRRRLQRQR